MPIYIPRGLDLVACNPPYKPEGTGIKNPQEGLSIARHEGTCTFAEIAAAAAYQLRWGGRFVSVYAQNGSPAPWKTFDMPDWSRNGVFCAAAAGQGPFLFLLQAARGGRPSLRVEPVLLVEDGAGGFLFEDVADLRFL